MGFRNRLKSKVRSAVGNLRPLGAVLHEEANHPGRPQPHMASRNPVWGGESGAVDPVDREDPPLSPSPVDSPDAPEGDDEVPWYLKYEDNEGWDDPNPGMPKDK